MKRNHLLFLLILVLPLLVFSCKPSGTPREMTEIQKKVAEYAQVKLTSDLFQFLSDKEKQLLPYLFEAAKLMDDIYWMQAYGNRDELLNSITDTSMKTFVEINYGPWERLNGNVPFLGGVGEKPKGAGFYPLDMTKDEFEAAPLTDKASLYTILRRDSAGKLMTVPYHIAYKEQIDKAAELLKKAADLAENEGLKKYLTLRAEALLTDDYLASDLAWMDMRSSNIDFVVGPIETYEDELFGYKAAQESYILLKDNDWSARLDKYNALLPKLQASLPVPKEYKNEVPGSESDMVVYDVVYYAGDGNAGSKTIAINLPNDERVQLEKGSRKLQLKNSMRYKFEQVLIPISNILIAEDQRRFVNFDAFFENTMFHEVAHGLGIKNTINGRGSVRDALKEQYSALEEGKADILGLYLVSKLVEMGEMSKHDLMNNYVTFLAGIFRSVRFGAADAHGKANMVRFYDFEEMGAFTRDSLNGTYKVDFDKMTEAMNSMVTQILTIQGNGDYEAAKKLIDEKGTIREALQKDLDRIAAAGIPRDIRFKQGPAVLGL
jgi:hypothetical protein